MTSDTKIILRELTIIETGIAKIIEQQDAILKHLELKSPAWNPADQAAQAYAFALDGVKKRLAEAGESTDI